MTTLTCRMAGGMVAVAASLLLLTACAQGAAPAASGAATTSATPAPSIAAAFPSDIDTVPGDAEAAADEATPDAYEPKVADFKVALKIREKACFGSAGCNVTYRIAPTYSGEPFEGTYAITYSVRGGEDGPQINTFTIEGDQASFDGEETISTRSSSSRLTVKVTEVSQD